MKVKLNQLVKLDYNFPSSLLNQIGISRNNIYKIKHLPEKTTSSCYIELTNIKVPLGMSRRIFVYENEIDVLSEEETVLALLSL